MKDEIRATIDLLGTTFYNAYIVVLSNVLTQEIPLANIVAMFEASHNGQPQSRDSQSCSRPQPHEQPDNGHKRRHKSDLLSPPSQTGRDHFGD